MDDVQFFSNYTLTFITQASSLSTTIGELSLPWLWLGHVFFVLWATFFPENLTSWQSDGHTSAPLQNFGADNFLMQSVTGFIYHQDWFNVWSHVLTFPIDLSFWTLYFNIYGKTWLGESNTNLFTYGHLLVCVLQAITVCVPPRKITMEQLHASAANQESASAAKSTDETQADPAALQSTEATSETTNTAVDNKEEDNQIHPFLSFLRSDFYWFQFVILVSSFLFWMIIVPYYLLPSMGVDLDAFWLTVIMISTSIFRVLGHMADFVPPLMFGTEDKAFNSAGKGFKYFFDNMSWRWVIQVPLGVLSEMCAGYPSRLYAWRVLADIRRLLNIVGVQDEQQRFFTLDWKEVELARDAVIEYGWKGWSVTNKLFHGNHLKTQ